MHFDVPGGKSAVSAGLGIRGQTAGASLWNYISVDSIEEPLANVEGLAGGETIQRKDEVQGQGWCAVAGDSEGNEFGLWESLPR